MLSNVMGGLTAPTTNPRTGGLIGASAGGNGSAGTNPTATGGWNQSYNPPGYDPNNPNVSYSQAQENALLDSAKNPSHLGTTNGTDTGTLDPATGKWIPNNPTMTGGWGSASATPPTTSAQGAGPAPPPGDPSYDSTGAGAAAATAGNNQANSLAVNPTLPGYTGPNPGQGWTQNANGTWAPPNPASATGAGGSAPTYGTQSGPGILQQWFDERANGTDPGYEYATGRGLTALNNQYAARGGFDSGASEQGDSDYLANMGSQRESQLDQLAGGASNENANQVSQMMGLGMGLGGGEAGLAGAYDLGAGGAMTNANNTGLQLSGEAAMIPYLARQQMMQNATGLLSSLI